MAAKRKEAANRSNIYSVTWDNSLEVPLSFYRLSAACRMSRDDGDLPSKCRRSETFYEQAVQSLHHVIFKNKIRNIDPLCINATFGPF